MALYVSAAQELAVLRLLQQCSGQCAALAPGSTSRDKVFCPLLPYAGVAAAAGPRTHLSLQLPTLLSLFRKCSAIYHMAYYCGTPAINGRFIRLPNGYPFKITTCIQSVPPLSRR